MRSCGRCAGIVAIRSAIATLRKCWRNAAFRSTIRRSIAGSSATPRRWRSGCAGSGGVALIRAGAWMKPTSRCGASGPTCTGQRSEEHTSELQSLMRISYAVFCLKKKKKHKEPQHLIPLISTNTHPKQNTHGPILTNLQPLFITPHLTKLKQELSQQHTQRITAQPPTHMATV